MSGRPDPKWYLYAYDLSMSNSPWTKNTTGDIDFLLKITQLKKGSRVLDLACGFGRHSLELAKRGYQAVGVDLSEEFIQYANNQAQTNNLEARFICEDLRNLKFTDEFDLVINLYDGAIGYLEDDNENLKIFKTISRALKRGGLSCVHLHRKECAIKNFPEYIWRRAEDMIELIELEWFETENSMSETTMQVYYNKVFTGTHPIREYKRLYSLDELKTIFKPLNLEIIDYYGDMIIEKPSSDKCRYFTILSGKK